MPKLNEVVTAILSSLSTAQHQSNQISKQFAESYQTDEIMKYFALPNATMSEAEITLRYAINEMVDADTLQSVKKYDISNESRYAARIRAVKIIDTLRNNDKIQALFDGTDNNVHDALKSHTDEISQIIYEGNKNGRSTEEIIKEILGILEKNFSISFENTKQIKNNSLKATKTNKIIEDISPFIKENIENLKAPSHQQNGLRNAAPDSSSIPKDLDIIIDNDILQKLPESVIQTIHIKAAIKNYRWLVTENSSSGEFILVS